MNDFILFDAGLFIGALLRGDSRHSVSRGLVELARRGEINVCTTVGILSEVYGALTWVDAKPPHPPREAAGAIRLLIEPPSHIRVLSDGYEISLKMLELAVHHKLTARRIHDARHASTAFISKVTLVCSYDTEDWKIFAEDGIMLISPEALITSIS